MIRSILGIVFVLTTAVHQPVMAAAGDPPCGAAEYRQFDFWIGEWRVSQGGKLAGNNSITRIASRCAILEQWTSVTAYRGSSITFYDADRKRWHQTWMGSDGVPLYLDGSLNPAGAMVLEGTTVKSDGASIQHRVSWSPLEAGGVRQLWEQRSGATGSWNVVFDGMYERP